MSNYEHNCEVRAEQLEKERDELAKLHRIAAEALNEAYEEAYRYREALEHVRNITEPSTRGDPDIAVGLAHCLAKAALQAAEPAGERCVHAHQQFCGGEVICGSCGKNLTQYDQAAREPTCELCVCGHPKNEHAQMGCLHPAKNVTGVCFCGCFMPKAASDNRTT